MALKTSNFRIFQITAVVVAGVIALYLFFFRRSNCDDYYSDYLQPMEINSTISSKYLEDHRYRRIMIVEKNEKRIIHISNCFKTFYDSVQEGDSVSKSPGSRSIVIYDKSTQLVKTFHFDSSN